MSIYAWLVVAVLLLALLLRGDVKGNQKYIILACLLLFCVYGLRDAYSIGNDSASSYLHGFQRMETTDWDELPKIKDGAYNTGFSHLMKLIYVCSNGDYQVFIIVVSAFVMLVFAHFIRKYSPSPVQSILYYFGLMYYTFMFNALKQSIAMAFVLLAFDAIMDRKLLKFLVMVLLGAWFHFPALVFLPAYWIANMKIGRSYLITLGLVLLLTYLFRDQLLELMLEAYDTEIHDSTMRFLANKVIVMIVIVIAALVLRPPTQDDRMYTALLQLIGIAIVLQTFASYNNTFERLADYYFQVSVVFIPMVFEKCDLQKQYLSPKENAMVKTLAPYVFCAFAVWRFLSSVQADATLSPYLFYFQK